MVRIHLPPAESQQTFGPSKWTGPPTSRRFSGAEVVGEFPKPADHNIGRGVGYGIGRAGGSPLVGSGHKGGAIADAAGPRKLSG